MSFHRQIYLGPFLEMTLPVMTKIRDNCGNRKNCQSGNDTTGWCAQCGINLERRHEEVKVFERWPNAVADAEFGAGFRLYHVSHVDPPELISAENGGEARLFSFLPSKAVSLPPRHIGPGNHSGRIALDSLSIMKETDWFMGEFKNELNFLFGKFPGCSKVRWGQIIYRSQVEDE